MEIGTSNFVFMLENGYYIDKSDILLDLFPKCDSGTSVIVNRPRRFGKTLMVSMIDTFFNQAYGDSSPYFEKLSIGKVDCKRYMNKYPVLRISFADIPELDSYDPIVYLKNLISSLYLKFADVFRSLHKSEYEQTKYENIINLTADTTFYASALKELTRYIYESSGIKPIVLIDEYDLLVEKYFDNPNGECIRLLESMYNGLLKDNEYLNFGFLTGVFSLAKGTLGSGLNNIPADNGIIELFSDNYFGFSQEDVLFLLKQHNIDSSEIKKLKDYYGGYCYYKKEYYNPWSILSYLKSRIYTAYWAYTTRSDLFEKLLQIGEGIGEDFENLSNGDSVLNQFDFSISYEDLYKNANNIILYLYLAGYLTSRQIGFSTYKSRIPNLEVKNCFDMRVIDRYKDKTGLIKLYHLKESFILGKTDEIEAYVKEFLLSSFSYYDFSDEKNYQVLVGVLSAVLFDACVIKYEVISGKGRCDIMISPRNENEYGAVIEVKAYKNKITKDKLEKGAEKALKQIIDNEYVEELRSRNASPIYAFGFAFYKKNISVRKQMIAKEN